MSNSNYSIGLQRLKPVHNAYCSLHNLAENWSWARDVSGRNRDVDNFSRDETKMRRWYVFRPSRDRDVETETTTLLAMTSGQYSGFRNIQIDGSHNHRTLTLRSSSSSSSRNEYYLGGMIALLL